MIRREGIAQGTPEYDEWKTIGKEVTERFFSNRAIAFKYKAVLGLIYHCPWLYDAYIQFFELLARVRKRLR